MSPKFALDGRGIQVRYQNREVLRGVDLQVAPGEFVVLLGLNGAGKSTLLRAVAGLVPLQAGSLCVEGQLGMLFQGGGLVPQLTALENVLCGKLGQLNFWQTLGGFPIHLQQQAHELLVNLGLKDHLQQRVSQLSGGQQQRVAIARALLAQPQILLADEPVAGLDVMTAQQVMAILANLNREQNLTIVVVLHDLALAETYGQRALFLEGGRISYDGLAINLQARFRQH